MSQEDRHLALLDSIHGAPDYDFDGPARRQPCPVCGGAAPTSYEDSSHDDCFGIVEPWEGETVEQALEAEAIAVDWLLRVRQLQAEGLTFDQANRQAIAEDDARQLAAGHAAADALGYELPSHPDCPTCA